MRSAHGETKPSIIHILPQKRWENRVTEPKVLDPKEEAIDTWAFLEVLGHQQLAGRLSTRKFGNDSMFQVDVPSGDKEMACSRLFSPAAIFSITPTTEEWCRNWQKSAEKNCYPILPYIPAPRPLRHGYMLDEHEEE
jgi:hypothetical protein